MGSPGGLRPIPQKEGDHAADTPVQVMNTRHMAHPATGTNRRQQQPKDRPSFRSPPERERGIPICRDSRAWA